MRRNVRLLLRVGSRRGDLEECTGPRNALGAVGGGKEPVVADAVEALGQHVQWSVADDQRDLETASAVPAERRRHTRSAAPSTIAATASGPPPEASRGGPCGLSTARCG